MSYPVLFTATFHNQPSLTLNATLYDSAGAQVGATIDSGFVNLGNGVYHLVADIPDGHIGTLVIYDSDLPSRCYGFAVNPQEIENADAKTSTRSTFAGGAVASVTGSVGSVAADVTLATATMQAIADELLKRSVSNVEASADTHSLAEVILALFESAAPATTWTIYRTDHATVFNTRTLTTDANAEPVTGVN